MRQALAWEYRWPEFLKSRTSQAPQNAGRYFHAAVHFQVSLNPE